MMSKFIGILFKQANLANAEPVTRTTSPPPPVVCTSIVPPPFVATKIKTGKGKSPASVTLSAPSTPVNTPKNGTKRKQEFGLKDAMDPKSPCFDCHECINTRERGKRRCIKFQIQDKLEELKQQRQCKNNGEKTKD